MQGHSLGLIETVGYTAAVEAVDIACKTGRVLFEGYGLSGKGLVTVRFSGEVAAVQAAVSAGAAAARKLGRVVSVHVIPRPHKRLGSVGPGAPAPPPSHKTRPAPIKEERVAPAKTGQVPGRERRRPKRPGGGKTGGKPKKQAP